MDYYEQLLKDIESINYQFSATGNHGHRQDQMNTKLLEFLFKVQELKTLEEVRKCAKLIAEAFPPLRS